MLEFFILSFFAFYSRIKTVHMCSNLLNLECRDKTGKHAVCYVDDLPFSPSWIAEFLRLREKMSSTILKKIISTAECPRPVGPYNHAVIVDRTVYLSGVAGVDVDTGKLVPGGIVPETIKTLENIKNLLRVTGSKIDNVIKCTVLLTDMNDFAAVNQEYTKGSHDTLVTTSAKKVKTFS